MVSVIILSAGSSSRMNGINKQLSAVGDIPVVAMSMQRFERCERVGEIILAAPEAECARYRSLAEKYGITKLKAVVSGGETRFLSVKSALRYVSDGAEYLAIHDGARPLIETREIDRVIADAEKYGAAIAGIRAVDTVKSVGADGFVESTPPRASLFYAQTPQVFSRRLYLECIERLGSLAESATDDSMLLEQCGKRVFVTEISCCNMKITRPDDLAAANAIISARKAGGVCE